MRSYRRYEKLGLYAFTNVCMTCYNQRTNSNITFPILRMFTDYGIVYGKLPRPYETRFLQKQIDYFTNMPQLAFNYFQNIGCWSVKNRCKSDSPRFFKEQGRRNISGQLANAVIWWLNEKPCFVISKEKQKNLLPQLRLRNLCYGRDQIYAQLITRNLYFKCIWCNPDNKSNRKFHKKFKMSHLRPYSC